MPLKSNLVVNKIYRHSDTRKKYMVAAHVSEKVMKREEGSKFLQTSTHLRVGRKGGEVYQKL